MTKLDEVNNIAFSNNIGRVYISPNKNKKYYIIRKSVKNGKPVFTKIHFGDSRYPDYLDYLTDKNTNLEEAKKRRELFHKRFKNHKDYNNKDSPLYYSQILLWSKYF